MTVYIYQMKTRVTWKAILCPDFVAWILIIFIPLWVQNELSGQFALCMQISSSLPKLQMTGLRWPVF